VTDHEEAEDERKDFEARARSIEDDLRFKEPPLSVEVDAPLEELVLARVREWFRRTAEGFAREPHHVARLIIKLDNAGVEEDEAKTLYLEADFVEEVHGDSAAGPVPGVKVTW
jgi:hypothetical protein